MTSLSSRALTDGWSVRALSDAPIGAGPVAAVVPGCVHLDLMRVGAIPDPYLDDNESALAWIGLVDWEYRTTLVVDAGELAAAERHDLVFEGLDTVATVSLNGEVVAETANQHRGYRIDVSSRLVAGDNDLVVSFASPVKYANEQSVALGVRQRPYPFPYEAMRKSASSFGWDWGIKTTTSGIWRPVALESWSTARLAETRVVASVTEGGGGSVDVVVDLERAAETPLTVRVDVAGRSSSVDVAAGASSGHVSVEVPDAELWWPAGYGEQPLYDVTVSLESSGAVLDSVERRVGFRTITWDTRPDAEGTPFTLHVNGVPVFVKGANWIPDDAFPVRVDRARYARRLDQALDANLNLIRVWGGGIYESDDFFELCDEKGLLTWQDFLFACAAYAEEEPLRGEIEAEARENIVRLAHHASLVLLTGNNENLWGYEDWGWKLRLDGKTWGAYYYYELFPALIEELAPHVPYAPGSPFSPGGEHPNDEHHGTMHIWDLWNDKDYPHYRDYRPRFVAEFGWQGPPAWSTLTRSISDDPLTPESPGMIVHQKAMEGNKKLTNGLIPHYRMPEEMESWHWAMQLNQANAITVALEHFRSHSPHTMGAIVWQLNDCWPVTSWAAVDGDERPKPLLYAMRNAFAPRLVTIQPRGAALAAVLVNDSPEPWSGELTVTRRAFDGVAIASQSVSIDLAARGTLEVPVDAGVGAADDAGGELLVADLTGVRGTWFFTEPRDSALPAAEFDLDVADAGDGVDVTVTARSLVRDLTFLVDKLAPEAVATEALLFLLPGESRTVHVSGLSGVDAAALARIARTANELVSVREPVTT
ncbi:glycoside hydrolase family 2 protein [Agromyces atrinae]|uniref:beta-mannosidase n=1 Tax=Agromyces atrinae TaxID=592376 RepID=A0A4V1R2P7_9MICO|nr:glycoside hydrolase family 2 protein [Agromyces atrinae]NYD67940.1 beta-mannosidase [Agromyces atrinae]RXZ87896.1 glycoside hydrolase family 2 protein [Agromyces atrinae]